MITITQEIQVTPPHRGIELTGSLSLSLSLSMDYDARHIHAHIHTQSRYNAPWEAPAPQDYNQAPQAQACIPGEPPHLPLPQVQLYTSLQLSSHVTTTKSMGFCTQVLIGSGNTTVWGWMLCKLGSVIASFLCDFFTVDIVTISIGIITRITY